MPSPISADLVVIEMCIRDSTRIERLFQEKGGILIGRCGNAIFRENKRAVRIFIHADPRIRQERISQWEQIPLKKAAHRMQEVDEERCV